MRPPATVREPRGTPADIQPRRGLRSRPALGRNGLSNTRAWCHSPVYLAPAPTFPWDRVAGPPTREAGHLTRRGAGPVEADPFAGGALSSEGRSPTAPERDPPSLTR